MTSRISELLITMTNANEIRNFLRRAFQKNLPLKPVLGLTSIAVVFIAVRPFFGGGSKKETSEPEKTAKQLRQETLFLIQQKEDELKKRNLEMNAQETQ